VAQKSKRRLDQERQFSDHKAKGKQMVKAVRGVKSIDKQIVVLG
jgi:hypothetical protein